MNKPLVSILIPVYNTEGFLPKCLDSIVNQTYSNLQVVIIDDGSKDASLCIAQKYAKQYPYIEVYHQENQGIASTRNNLLDKAKGDYVLFVDSDDWCELDMVDFLINKAIANKADMVTCSMVKNNETFVSNIFLEEIWDREKAVLEFLRHKIFNGSLCNKLIKTSLLHNLRFHCGIFYGEDALFLWKVLQSVDSIVVTNKILYHYRMNNNSLSHLSWTPDKKGTSKFVWKKITEETEKRWPQYIDIVKVRAALEDMWALYYASASAYHYDDNIKVRQRSIRNNLGRIIKSDIASRNMKIYALISSLSYKLLKYIH